MSVHSYCPDKKNMAESDPLTETNKIVNPRVEIDTSPPFESVKEAVDRFGGRGPWIPNHLLRLAAARHDTDFDMDRVEDMAKQLEKDLVVKERETLNVLKELEAVKRFVEDLKINLTSCISSPDRKYESHPDENTTDRFNFCPGLMFLELNQAKSNLSKTSIDLAMIQASVESLNKKMLKDKTLLEKRTKMRVPSSQGVLSIEENHQTLNSDISIILGNGLDFEAEQFQKISEASRYEVMKAMTEIEQTKNSIKMAEMRLNAAKKMEEAARAVKAIAVAQKKAHLSNENSFVQKADGITLSLREYRMLTQKAQQADKLCRTKFVDSSGLNPKNELHVPVLEKFDESNKKSSGETNYFKEGRHVKKSETNSTTYKFRNSHPGHGTAFVLNENESHKKKERSTNGFWSKTSMGEILGRNLILQDSVVMGRKVESQTEREHISLSQMLSEQSRLILHSDHKETADGNVEKRFFMLRKKFGFIQVPIPTKHSKKNNSS